MKLIIEIPEENYKLICSDGRPFLPSYKWIKNGIPLEQIRDEIQKVINAERDFTSENARAQAIALNWCLDIIDKQTKGE